MSSALAIAGVSAVLTNLLDNGIIDNDLPATVGGPVKVSAKPPDRVPPVNGTDPNQLNLFLYHVAPNPGWRNRALPSRDSEGARVSNAPLALDLFYLLTAYGDKDFQAEILLGYAMQLFHETPVLTRDAIRTALIGSNPPVTGGNLPNDFKALVAGDLAEQIEQIKIIPQSMSTEEMSKLWTALSTPYRPTAAYQVSVVLIESRRPTRPTLPVRERIVKAVPFQRPTIDAIESAAGAEDPIVASSTIVIKGRELRGAITSVVIGGIPFVPAPNDLGADQIKISLLPVPSGVLRAGVQTVQVVHEIDLGKPEVPHRGVESNVAAFVLHPRLIPPPPVPPSTVSRAAGLTLTFNPAVGRSQRVTFLLGEHNPPAGRPARAFSVPAPSENGITTAGQTETSTIQFVITDVELGEYFVRVQVDGAESALSVDPVVGSPTENQFTGPLLKIV